MLAMVICLLFFSGALHQNQFSYDNPYFDSRRRHEYQVYLTDSDIPLSLQPIPQFKLERPSQQQIAAAIAAQLDDDYSTQALKPLARACQGLGLGEIYYVIKQQVPFTAAINQLSEAIINYKLSKLCNRGIEWIAQPDVPSAGGLDLLHEHLKLIHALFDSRAQSLYGLKPPRGMILWGTPGTGKSLSAKLAAKQMGVPLLTVDWSAIVSDEDLRYLLETAEAMSPCILYFDDFEKSFSLDAQDGGASRRRAGKLLTWMQEHQSQVFVMATVNRLGMLPPELIRRFEEEIWFIDLPHDGARYEIFTLHLSKYFPDFQPNQPIADSPWSERQWRRILTEYRLCTPAEIANAIRRIAQRSFQQRLQSNEIGLPLQVSVEQIIEERFSFTPSLEREEDAILEIRNKASFAKPASSFDRSPFAREMSALFS